MYIYTMEFPFEVHIVNMVDIDTKQPIVLKNQYNINA